MSNTLEDPKHKEFSTGSKEWFSGMRIGPGSNPDMFVYFNDFGNTADYAAADWTVTETGIATQAIASDEKYGALLITNAAADNDLSTQQLNEETFALDAGKKLWYETRVKINDVDQVDNFFGLCITDTTPLDATDRVGFQLTDESASLDFLCEKNSVETKEDTEVDAVDATYVKLGFYWDGSNKVEYYVDRQKRGTISTNIPNDENLAITIHHQNGEAAAQTCTVDYIFVAVER